MRGWPDHRGPLFIQTCMISTPVTACAGSEQEFRFSRTRFGSPAGPHAPTSYRRPTIAVFAGLHESISADGVTHHPRGRIFEALSVLLISACTEEGFNVASRARRESRRRVVTWSEPPNNDTATCPFAYYCRVSRDKWTCTVKTKICVKTTI